VYDHDGALTLAQNLLQQLGKQLYPTYNLASTITTTMQKVQLTAASSSKVTMTIHVDGSWIPQRDVNSTQAFALAIAGKPEPDAQALLNSQPYFAVISIQLRGGNVDILPTDPRQITFTYSVYPRWIALPEK
jgi:hypothetical protein